MVTQPQLADIRAQQWCKEIYLALQCVCLAYNSQVYSPGVQKGKERKKGTALIS